MLQRLASPNLHDSSKRAAIQHAPDSLDEVVDNNLLYFSSTAAISFSCYV